MHNLDSIKNSLTCLNDLKTMNPYQPFIIPYWHCNIQANLAYLYHINMPMNSAAQPNYIVPGLGQET